MNLPLQKAFLHLCGFVPEKLSTLGPWADACEYVECPHPTPQGREQTICQFYTYVDPRAGFEARIAICHTCGRGFN